MGGVADEDHPTLVPAVEFDPFDRAGVELLVPFQGGEVRPNRAAEVRESAPEPLQASWVRIVEPFRVQSAKP